MTQLFTSLTLAAVLLGATTAAAQDKPATTQVQPTPSDPQRVKPTIMEPERYESQANVRIEISIADSVGGAQKKTVSMIVAEGYMGRVRSQRGAPVLNVDATPRLQKDGRIALQLVLEYRPRETAETIDMLSPINGLLTVLLTSGKPLVVTQAADPTSDRKVSVEVTATVLK